MRCRRWRWGYLPCLRWTRCSRCAVIALEHDRHDRAIAVEDAIEIDIDRLLPLIDGVLPGGSRRARHTRRADERIDASEPARRRLCRCIDAGDIGNVDDADFGRVAESALRAFQRRRVPVPKTDPAAAGDQPLRDSEADACGTAGDDRGAAVEVESIHGSRHLDALGPASQYGVTS